jgi:DNA topoisomerase-6 subunit A
LFNVAHAKKFMQTLLVASFCKDLIKENLHASLRDMFYNLKRTLPNSNENTFDEQTESDPIVADLEVALNVLREQLHLTADVRGRVVGDVIIVDRGDRVNWSKLGSGGWAIPSNVEDIKFKKVNTKFILVIEKNAAFERLHEDGFWKKHKCILITTQGQAARGCRRLIQRLSQEFNLPVYVFCDSDPYGWYIYSVIKYGSMSLAHVSDRLGTPAAKYIGLTISDIDKFKLHNFTIKAKEVDIKRAKDMLNYPWFKHPAWQNELKLLIQRKIKAELEALSGRGLKFVTEVYLPTKIKNREFLP